MANVFKQVTEPNNRVNVSNFDLSFQNNLTMQFGYLYPCFVKKFAPKTSVKIKPTFGLNFMPMMFPVQTRMRARMSFYKVRCRSVWKDYKDWFGNLKPNLVKPYINFNTEDKLKKMASTGSLGDYLGLPTTFPPLYSALQEGSFSGLTFPGTSVSLPSRTVANPEYLVNFNKAISENIGTGVIQGIASASTAISLGNTADDFVYQLENLNSLGYNELHTKCVLNLATLSPSVDIPSTWLSNSTVQERICKAFLTVVATNNYSSTTYSFASSIVPREWTFSYDSSSKILTLAGIADIPDSVTTSMRLIQVFPSALYWNVNDESVVFTFVGANLGSDYKEINLGYSSTFGGDPYLAPYAYSPGSSFSYQYVNTDTNSSVVGDISLSTSPYYSSVSVNKEKQLKIDASFYRAYEAIYNAYFRDIRNNPFIVNGQPEYNVFIPSDEGGEDNNTYELRRRNWEADFLTTAVPSPQQGRAPLVGITTYGDTGETQFAFTAEDGKKYAVTYDYNSDKGELENLAFQQLSDDAVIKEPRNMMDLVSSGISISDLRNVNAYTKFLELNMRKGYFYKDLVEGHFDTKVRYDELNMPEFIGGTAKDVFVNPVSQTVQTSQDGSYFGALGSYAGQASVSGQADNTISAYFDEETIVIGLISIVPVANYSQLLPKHFLHRELLDSYFPEFDNIGFQPILYNEVCPVQAYNDNPDKLLDLFGYQRPWYDYVASVDETHGLFRTNLRNFLINRVFRTQPTLSEDFLLVDPEQVNDVFSVTETTDKILGQIWFDVQVKAPISRIAIPRLD